MSESLSPLDVVQIAANDRRARFQVIITDTIDGFELDSDGSVKITIAEQEIALTSRYIMGYGAVQNRAIEIRKAHS